MNAATSDKMTSSDPSPEGWRLASIRVLIAVSALVAAFLSFGIGEATHRWFRPELILQSVIGSAKAMLPTLETDYAATTRNAAVAFAALGACLAGALGVAGGCSRKSVRGALAGGVGGLLLGGLLGAGISLAVIPSLLRARYLYSEYEMIIGFVIHGVPWAVIGGASGAAFSLGRGDGRSLGHSVLAGVFGALIGSIAFDILGGLFFASAEIENPISETRLTRFLARLMVGIGTALGLMFSLSPRGPKPIAGEPPIAAS